MNSRLVRRRLLGRSGLAEAPAGYTGSDEREWEDGYRDGRILAVEIELARRLERCIP